MQGMAAAIAREREDIDHSKIRITGESLGGMHAWFAAFVDTRYAVVVPIIGVQGFRWAIDNDKWHARVDNIKPVFTEAAVEIRKNNLDKEVVEKVWDRIAPGLASKFDSPDTIPAIAPHPLLILNEPSVQVHAPSMAVAPLALSVKIEAMSTCELNVPTFTASRKYT
ncbi:hypothetical protein IFM89_002273 [Coptis chinensis]|uniref:Peptidase S9 prolyl oligopeptidase catalytic domain-containing protein n=1 Tax=Coptis chinensis TaxID=261450 RepID=A0A835M3S4_9MAGN|nr:hypothetical protein IFM89_002273 [Coptis chinensis]